MIVKELISRLKKLPPNLIVVTCDENNEHCNVGDVTLSEVGGGTVGGTWTVAALHFNSEN